ncbi:MULTISPECIES: MarR family transcriptional regulator [unclassified Paenibacillus]|uniref:MarR family winged helix-turn-helix transcriptional regulator n=1 Tax=unclassified Paenibacillus TaxID=185978 RepID=UPI00240707C1|nr:MULTISPECIES: MarR family transcriptional regulator [unclassified Paenibacillus]MDF9841558.1 DNA-binding MarR family transcriptional regulator [Paenibacillus sp. PastF-2]MDF9848330.1 DNA-binding MarR family transcriptional regulator [Paenibacillus sp. PastM-2]MDF9854717.1 DNA-binding MarR family transcriptional regulator [Paenibacillus sp. PastF-1]MDH6479987.1 DNA-binding MarR family transcriptional regulator [Paenibacillus sp. PastH-2]MDH6507421.1 DNA-binding MarR family transcriptional re
MDSQIHQEEQLLKVFENIRSLTNRTNWNGPLPYGEFLMMFMIDVMMKKEGARPDSPECRGIMVSRLSDLLQISRPTASQTISTLEDKGYIERAVSETDRRAVYISLTGEGQEVFRERMARYSGILHEIVEKVGREEVDQLLTTCDRLRSVVEEVRQRYAAGTTS